MPMKQAFPAYFPVFLVRVDHDYAIDSDQPPVTECIVTATRGAARDWIRERYSKFLSGLLPSISQEVNDYSPVMDLFKSISNTLLRAPDWTSLEDDLADLKEEASVLTEQRGGDSDLVWSTVFSFTWSINKCDMRTYRYRIISGETGG